MASRLVLCFFNTFANCCKTGLDADDIISQLHDVLVGRRLSLPDELRSELLSALAICDTQIRSTMHARIPFENFLHKAATSGKKHGLAFG